MDRISGKYIGVVQNYKSLSVLNDAHEQRSIKMERRSSSRSMYENVAALQLLSPKKEMKRRSCSCSFAMVRAPLTAPF